MLLRRPIYRSSGVTPCSRVNGHRAGPTYRRIATATKVHSTSSLLINRRTTQIAKHPSRQFVSVRWCSSATPTENKDETSANKQNDTKKSYSYVIKDGSSYVAPVRPVQRSRTRKLRPPQKIKAEPFASQLNLMESSLRREAPTKQPEIDDLEPDEYSPPPRAKERRKEDEEEIRSLMELELEEQILREFGGGEVDRKVTGKVKSYNPKQKTTEKKPSQRQEKPPNVAKTQAKSNITEKPQTDELIADTVTQEHEVENSTAVMEVSKEAKSLTQESEEERELAESKSYQQSPHLQEHTPLMKANKKDPVQKHLQKTVKSSSELEYIVAEDALVYQGIPVPSHNRVLRFAQRVFNTLLFRNMPDIVIDRELGGFKITLYNKDDPENSVTKSIPFEAVIESATNPVYLADLAVAYRREGLHHRADAVINSLMKRFGDDPAAVEDIAQVMVLGSTPLDAYPWVRRAFDISEKKARRHLYACLEILHELGETERLLETIEEGQLLDPNDFIINLKAAEVHYELGNHNEVMKHLKQVEIPADYPHPEPIMIYADLLYNTGEFDQAEAEYKKIVNRFPNLADPMPYMKLSYLALERGDTEEAQVYFRQAQYAKELRRRIMDEQENEKNKTGVADENSEKPGFISRLFRWMTGGNR